MLLDKTSRRDFLRTTSSAAIGSAVPAPIANTAAPSPFSREDLFHLGPQREFGGDKSTQVAMPIGGIGAGCICLNGYGGLQDFSIRNDPALTAAPGAGGYRDAAFAVLHVREKNITRLVEGPFPKGKIYAQGNKPEGILGGGH